MGTKRIKLFAETVRDEIRARRIQIKDLEAEISRLRREIRDIRKQCPHENCEKDFDASGSNRTSYTCLDCGGDV